MPRPVLGILALYMNEAKQLEEKSVYRRMIIEGRALGLDVYVFTPMEVSKDGSRVQALIYDEKAGVWKRQWRSLPDIIYDRCRIQKSYRFQQLLQFRSRFGHLLFLNRPLRNKWTVYQTFSQKKRFRPHLPDTVLYQGPADLDRMLKHGPVIYVKPANGTGGRGILRIERVAGRRGVYDIQGRRKDRHIITPRKVNRAKLDQTVRQWCKDGRYLVQQGIPLRLPEGRFHDYRMLVQKNGEGVWEVTGMAGRIGAARSVTSNLHGGGRAVRAERLLKSWLGGSEPASRTMRAAERLGIDAASYLESSYDALCELALDLAIDREGRIFILEVNPKPMREVFARSGDQATYRKALTRPLEYALWLYKNKNTPSSAKTEEE